MPVPYLCRLIPGLLAAVCLAQAQTAAPDAVEDKRSIFPRISGLFSGNFPELDPEGRFKVILRPHFGDLIHRDYMRVDTGLRWAVNENFELTSEALAFFTHGLGDPAGYGIGKLRLGSKYVFEAWPKRSYATTLAANVDLPVGHAPPDMTDGHHHFTPNIVIQHPWARNPRLITFTGLGLDLLWNSAVPGRFATNQPHDDSISITGGAIYDLGQIKWTFAATYATTAITGKSADQFVNLEPGIQWYVPRKYTFHSHTQWIFGLNARTSWGPDGIDYSLGSRLRAEITFRQVMRQLNLMH